MKLNLQATDNMQKVILDYLEQNVTETLANKINNGVEIEKNNKKLINKKTLKGFWNYATQEAQKMAEQGARSAVIQDEIVFGWAIHYFEEDSIEEELYNIDGSKFELPKPQRTKSTINTTPVIPKEKPKTKQEQAGQMSLFDLFDNPPQQEEPKQEIVQEEKKKPIEQPKQKGGLVYQKYMEIQNKYPNAIVAYRIGDFYEIFGENAKIVAEKIDLTLTGRECGLPERQPMVGFPYHAAESYINKITDFATVVVFEYNQEILHEQKKPRIDKVVTAKQEVVQNNAPKTLLEQYKDLADSYPDFIIAIQIKNWYEIYGDNAKKLAKEFGFLLQIKDGINCIRGHKTIKNHWINCITQTHNIAFGSNAADLEFYTIKQ